MEQARILDRDRLKVFIAAGLLAAAAVLSPDSSCAYNGQVLPDSGPIPVVVAP